MSSVDHLVETTLVYHKCGWCCHLSLQQALSNLESRTQRIVFFNFPSELTTMKTFLLTERLLRMDVSSTVSWFDDCVYVKEGGGLLA